MELEDKSVNLCGKSNIELAKERQEQMNNANKRLLDIIDEWLELEDER
jgi:hypothetical protein